MVMHALLACLTLHDKIMEQKPQLRMLWFHFSRQGLRPAVSHSRGADGKACRLVEGRGKKRRAAVVVCPAQEAGVAGVAEVAAGSPASSGEGAAVVTAAAAAAAPGAAAVGAVGEV